MLVDAPAKARASTDRLLSLTRQFAPRALVKPGFVGSSGQVEHLWAEALEMPGDAQPGVRLATPPMTHTGRLDRLRRCPVDDIEDGQVRADDGRIHGGFSRRAMSVIAARDGVELPEKLSRQQAACVDARPARFAPPAARTRPHEQTPAASPASPGGHPASGSIARTLDTGVRMPSHAFNELFDGKTRPSEYGNVTIDYETVNPGLVRQFTRPVLASGYIYPMGSTSGRKSAPEPESGFRIGATKTVPKAALAVSARNTGRVDMDKGHIFALELGGPDVAENICPQFSQLQRNGEWRRMEVEAWKRADESDHLVFMTIAVVYGNAQTFSRALTPAGFLVDLHEDDGRTRTLLKSYKIYNTQDLTDDKLAYRLDADIEPEKTRGSMDVQYGASSGPRSFDRPVIGVRINGRDIAVQKALSRRSSLAPGVQGQVDAMDVDTD